MEKKIAVLPGDGIGPEVMEQAIQVLNAVATKYNHTFKYCKASVGACAIDKYNNPLPDTTLESCHNSDAILFGAIGHPRFDNDPDAKIRPEQGLLKLRKSMGLFCNIRPVTTFPKLLHLSPLRPERVNGVDLVIYRELTGGIYFGDREKDEAAGTAFDTCKYSVEEITRMAHPAFQAAQKRRKKLTLVDKANVLESSRLWRATVKKVAKEYPDVTLDFMFVDNAAMQLIINPASFDVILTSNMFGDILSDEASVLPGSMGLLPSASIGKGSAMFEPIHGSWPEAAGQDIANPFAMILSAAMMLDYFEMTREAEDIRGAVYACLENDIGTADLQTGIRLTCSQIGEIIVSYLTEGPSAFKADRLAEGASTII
ncbi:MAG: 3-isopropylmalate dehydrogenase [Saprospiraceae bacterium]